jgi:hypothetical protein
MEKPHKNLEAWKQSIDLVVEIYRTTQHFPGQETYGLSNQIRRAAGQYSKQHRGRRCTANEERVYEFPSHRSGFA